MVNFEEFKKRQDWHPADIKAELEKKGLSLAKLARKNGYSRHAPSVALIKPWPAMEKIIADTIGVPARIIWPSRYDRYGLPNRRLGRKPNRVF